MFQLQSYLYIRLFIAAGPGVSSRLFLLHEFLPSLPTCVAAASRSAWSSPAGHFLTSGPMHRARMCLIQLVRDAASWQQVSQQELQLKATLAQMRSDRITSCPLPCTFGINHRMELGVEMEQKGEGEGRTGAGRGSSATEPCPLTEISKLKEVGSLGRLSVREEEENFSACDSTRRC